MMPNKMKLVLENGMEFTGPGFGADVPAVGEIVFNTSMVGYQEILSDPSYAGQIILLTYPLIGQYGITDEDFEARNAAASGFVVRECCDSPSNFRFTKTLSEEMEDRGVPGISGLDTRMLTRIIRENGPMRAAIVPESVSKEKALEMIASKVDDRKLLESASCTKRWFSRTFHHNYDVVILDCGVKHGIVRALNDRGCNVTVVPFDSGADEIMAFHPDGVLISSGPGNPYVFEDIIEVINTLKGRVPIVGIGLGFELIALSYGQKLEKSGCGLHGGAPVTDVRSNRIITVEHNYSFSLGKELSHCSGLEVSYRNAVDGSIVGIENASDKVSAVQFYAEGCPGSQESDFFDRFIKSMED